MKERGTSKRGYWSLACVPPPFTRVVVEGAPVSLSYYVVRYFADNAAADSETVTITGSTYKDFPPIKRSILKN